MYLKSLFIPFLPTKMFVVQNVNRFLFLFKFSRVYLGEKNGLNMVTAYNINNLQALF